MAQSTPMRSCARPLRAGEVHVWRVELGEDAADPSLLDADERARAQRFAYADDRRRFIAAHAWVRRILGAYLDMPPRAIEFGVGPHGKPVLLSAPGAGLRFNLSHSKDMALLGVAAGIEIGVDIEALRDDLPGPELAAGVLSAAELAELEDCAQADHARAFVGCWTRKEACLKALGVGLKLQPRTLDIGLQSRRAMLHVDGQPEPIDVAPLQAPRGFCAAVAAVGGFAELAQHDCAECLECLD